MVTDVAVAYAGTEIEPPVGLVLSSVRVSVVALELLPALSVPLTGMVGAPEADVQEIAVETNGPPAGVLIVSELWVEKPVPPESVPNVADFGPEAPSLTASWSLNEPAALPL